MSTRVDAWIWAIRLTKTRSAAGAACRGGHVRVNGATAKPAQPVVPGDEVRVRLSGRERVVEVTKSISKRVSAPMPPNATSTAVRPRRPEKSSRANPAAIGEPAGPPNVNGDNWISCAAASSSPSSPP